MSNLGNQTHLMKSYLVTVACGLLAALCVTRASAEKITFDHVFAPQSGLVSSYEKPQRQEICLNGTWQFQADKDVSVPDALPKLGEWEKTAIKIPSPWNVNSFSMDREEDGGDFRAYPSYPKEWENVRAAWMQKTVTVPKEWAGQRLLLHFGAIGGNATVFVNGQKAGQGFDIFFPQEYDVTDLLHPGAENQILVKVVSSRVFDKPGRYGRREYLSGSFWGTHIAGIWQDVYLLAEPNVSVSEIYVQPWVDRDELQIEATVINRGSTPATVDLSGEVREWLNQTGDSVLEKPEVKWSLADKKSLDLPAQKITVAPNETQHVIFNVPVKSALKLWSPDAPNLYGILLHIAGGGKTVDTKYERFGWRQFSFQGNKLLLNGQPITLKGDSWHFLGIPQMTRRYAYAWYRLLKDAGANAVRLHATVYPPLYHEMADEMGMMILDESAIWLSDGGPKADSDLFWTNCRTHVEELVRRDRNHPSVFGWSVCNESLAVLRNVWHAPKSMIDHNLAEISAWVEICRTNDPTRPWISGDGEDDANGRLPTINIHYGGDNDMRRAANSGKPWGVGETSMAYYGTPEQVSKFNGDRAYESDLGRMEGLAYECYGLLRAQQKFGGDYQSVFNIVWYSIQPLPLGKSVVTRPIQMDEGIFFGDYKEGMPGVQPERLGPYCSTLNPGYDSSLPLYRPWPMFEAIRDANTGVTNSQWAEAPRMPVKKSPTADANMKINTIAYLPDNGARLATAFGKVGIKPSAYSDNQNTDFLLVDASKLSDSPGNAESQAAISKTLQANGTVWIWNLDKNGAAALSKILGSEITVDSRPASSFVIKQADALTAGLGNPNLYFSDNDNWRQLNFTLGGDFVKGSKVAVDACVADWRRWSYKSEPVKTAALYRSEVERPGPLAAVVIREMNPGRVILCNISPDATSKKKSSLIERLFRNEGIQPQAIDTRDEYLDAGGHLIRALVSGSFGVKTADDAYAVSLPDREIKEDGRINGRRWVIRQANDAGVFDFKTALTDGPQENAFAYVVVWIKSPKPLNDLLSEPNLPKLSFIYGSDDGCEVWLNHDLLATHNRTGPLEPEGFTINPLLLKLGWNQLIIRVVQGQGEWKFTGKFECSDKSFVSKLEFATDKPAAQ
ncbi:MAG TPA: glycoside hydrolase family 2 TIM barrel-domain containing protein [Verrucomicrobiae bacterium]|jgi:beta-galactosidase|nr:glycoside hydrolase family 2 TIM barrel-domain containing protein [Verrucomicrobiae bacterium]